MALASAPTLAGFKDREPDRTWFGRRGCVENRRDGTCAVYVNGDVIGLYEEVDVAARDVLIAIVLQYRSVKRADVARAFDVSVATVGRVMTRLKQGGLGRVADAGRQRGASVITPMLRRRLAALFANGKGPRAAHRAVGKLASYGTVQSLHAQWVAERAEPEQLEQVEQLDLTPLASNDESAESARLESSAGESGPAPLEADETEPSATSRTVLDSAQIVPVDPSTLESSLEQVLGLGKSRLVQHAGSWLMLAMLEQFGVYEAAEQCRPESPSAETLRTALDAAAISLSIGQRTIEGVRRLQTPSGPMLLRRDEMISASWVRRILGRFADEASILFQAKVAATLLQRHDTEDPRVWLYVDNHMRAYTGKHVIRKGWKMQAKRAVYGCTDYYVHDEDGRPLWRMATPSHDSLSQWLEPVVDFTQIALGDDIVPCLVFDRGGAFPQIMAQLRDQGAEFVTYERGPYPKLPDAQYDRMLEFKLASRPQQGIVIRYTELGDRNLGSGHGRVRRIYLLMPDGEKINLLSVSTLDAEALIRRQLARWGVQENQFKHEVERWGINQLDGRAVEPYPQDAIIPNPDRRQLDNKLRLACVGEGEALRKLFWMDDDDPEREHAERDRQRTVDHQHELRTLRAQVPRHAPVKDTSLAGKLKRHKLPYKRVVDTVRIALANAESELAVRLARHLDRPREAKKTLANLLLAPATIRLAPDSITVALMPAASSSERAAFAPFLRAINRLGLCLPGDPQRRPLCFRLKKHPNH